MSTEQIVQQAVTNVTANPLADPSHHTANLANAVTAVYGLTGSGKTSLAVTAVEYCWESFHKYSLYYAADIGGFGTKLLAAVRAGIAYVYDPRNHVDPFATMEAISLGAFPAYLLPGGGATREERERGYAPPDCELVMPHRRRFTIKSVEGAVLGVAYDVPTAQTLVTQHPGSQIVTEVVRSRGFAQIGLRVYDSMTSLNDWGMSDLQEQSAKGLLPTSTSGGSALGGADALISGTYKFGTSSKAQFGFLQNRSYGWLANIRSIPDQAVPAIVTFMVEQSKGDDESGGVPVFGPKIAGNARTSSVGGWVGNLTYAAREPNENGHMVHRLWLVNHVDPRDPRGIPYLAKHRGTPLGMPEVLEDALGSEPWSTCSLAVLFRKLDEQVKIVEAQLKARYPDAPGMQFAAATEDEEVVRQVTGSLIVGGPAPGGLRVGGLRMAAPGQPVASLAPVGVATGTPVAVPAAAGLRKLRVAGSALVTPPAVTPPAVATPAVPQSGTAVDVPVAPVDTAPQKDVAPPMGAQGPAAPVATPVLSPTVVPLPPAGAPLTPATPLVPSSAAPRTVLRSRVPRPPV